MKTQKGKFLIILVTVLALAGLVASAQASVWDSTMAYYATSVTKYDVAVGDKLKGASDDTVRIFTTQNGSTYRVLLLTDRSSGLPMSWQADTVFTDTYGNRGVAIGDPDRDLDNDLVFGRTSSPYQLKRVYWSGSAWVVDTIRTFPSSIYDVAIGDADNDGYADDIVLTNSYHVFLAHWNGASWDTTRLYNGTSTTGTCYGVAIGDFDATYSGNEIAAVTYGQRVLRIRWDSGTSAWITDEIYDHGVDIDLYDVAVGDFDSDNPGDEIAINNGYGYATHGAVLELYGSGASWTLQALYTPSTGWGGSGEIAVGDFYAGNAGDEIVAVSGSGSAYEARLVYGSGTTWYNEKIMGTGGSTYGVAIGDLNRYRSGNELAVGGYYKVWEAEEHIMADNMATLSIDNPTAGAVLQGNSSITIQATVQNAATNTQNSVPVILEISDASKSVEFIETGSKYLYSDTVYTGTLTQGQSEQVTFTPDWTVPNAFASYTITVWTALSGDEYADDDTLIITVTALPEGYAVESFEGTLFPPEGWAQDPSGNWARSSGSAHSGSYKARARGQNAWLFTPWLSVQAGDSLKFWYRSESASYPTSFYVRLSTGTNQTDTSDYTNILADYPNVTSTTYLEGTIDLSPYARVKGAVYIAFHRYFGQSDSWYLFLDDVTYPPIYVPVNDMATISIDDVPGMVETGSDVTIKATVQNQASQTASTGVPVRLKIEGPLSYVYEDTAFTTIDLDPDSVEQITFTPDWHAPDTLCNYTVTIWTELAGDEDASNDTLSQIVTVYRAGGLVESFTGTTFPPAGWTVYAFDGGDVWSRWTTYYHTAPACARIYYDLPNNDWLITPRLKAQDGDKLKFWWKAHSPSYEETLWVRVSTNSDVSDTASYGVVDSIMSNDTTWAGNLEVVDLSAYAGQDIYIAFYYKDYNNYGVAIDDVSGPYFPTQIALSVDSLYFESFPDTSFCDPLYIRNVGGGLLEYEITKAQGSSWLSVDPNSGEVPGGEEDTIAVCVNTAGLDGHYYDTLIIVSNSGEKEGDTTLVPIEVWVRLIPEISIDPDSFAVGVASNDTKDTAMFISNTGNGDLDYEIETEEWTKSGVIYDGERPYKEHGEAYKSKIISELGELEKDREDPRRGVPPTKGQGGPDAYGYRWIDSDEPNGPTFSWVEINSVGTQVDVSDDGNVGPFPIGFTFNFYGTDFTQFRVAGNGFVSFTSTSGTLTNASIPTTGEPNNLLALMWDDLRTAYGGGAGNIYYHNDGSRLIIEYDHVMRYAHPECPYTMEIILYPNGKIIYQYLTMGEASCSTYHRQATIGIENGTGTDGLEVVFNAPYVHNNLAIRFSSAPEWIVYSPESGTVPPSETDTIDVTFDATGILSGELFGAFLISSNAPDKALDTVPVHLTILTPEMTFDPESLVTSATEGQAPYDLTMDIGNAGDGRLIFNIVEGIPWLSASPVTDTVDAGEGATTITLTINCTSLYAGKYLGQIKVYSNDPDLLPYATYKVYLTVGPDPDIAVTPEGFDIGLYAGLTLDTTLTIDNEGDGHLVWGLTIEELSTPKSPDTILTEGFEGTWPPSGWSDPDLWQQDCSGYYMHTGLCGAYLPWGYGLDEWLITPPLTLGTGSYLKFWWESSFYWHVSPYDNGDLFVKVSTNGGSSWTTLWTFGDSAMVVNSGGPWPWSNFIMYEATLDLSAYTGTALIGFHVVADDNADIAFDDVVVESFGAPWLSISEESGVLDPHSSKDITVSFSSVGVTEDKYANIWVTSNDPDEDPIQVPVHLQILGPEYSIDPPETLVINATEDTYTDGHLYISNFGGHAPLIYTMTDPVAWLSESPDSENVAIDGTQDVTVTVDGNQLISGDYQTYIAIETNDFDEGYDTIIVVVHVGPDPCIETDPDSFYIQVSAGGTKDTTLNIANDCDGTLAFEITTEDVTPVFGAARGQDRFYEILRRNQENHPSMSGAFSSEENTSAHLTAPQTGFTPSGSGSTPDSPVLAKGDTVFIQLPHDPSESWSFGTSDQGAGYKMYENFWGVDLPISDIHFWGLALVYSGGWIQGDPNNLVFDITFYSDPPDDPSLPPTQVACTYTNVVPPVIIPTQLYSGYQAYFFGGVELSPLCNLEEGWVSIQSKSAGSGYDWFLWASAKTGDGFSYQENGTNPRYYDQALILGGGVAWLTVSPEADTVDPHTSTNVTVHCDATDILGGEKFGNIIIEHNVPGKGTTIVPVHMVIGGAQYFVTPDQLDIDALEDQYTTEYLTVSNPGGESPLSYKMTCPAPWLSINPDTADIDPDGSLEVSVRVDGYQLIAGDYYTEIAVKTNAANQQQDTIPVSVHVGPDAEVDIAPLSFEVGIMPGCTGERTVTVNNLGLGHLGFQVSIATTMPKLSAGENGSVREQLEALRNSVEPRQAVEGAQRTIGFNKSPETIRTEPVGAGAPGSSGGMLISGGKQADILLVDDDGGLPGGTYTDVEDAYMDALDANGLAYDYYVVDWTTPTSPGPGLSILQNYSVVIWWTGETWGYYGDDTITPTDETNLADYLDGGGSLFLSAQDYLYDRYPSAGSFSPGQFPYDYLGVQSVSQDAINDPYTVVGGVGSVAEGMQFDCLRCWNSTTVPLWTDYLYGQAGAVDVFLIGTEASAVQFEVDRGFRTVFTTTAFPGLVDNSPSTRAEFIASVVDWLGGGVGCPFTVTPEADTLDPESSLDLLLTFDGEAFEACGVETLTCYLVFSTNDPDETLVTVPVTMWSARGELTGDCVINVGDVVFLLNYVFGIGPAPDPLCMGDVDRDDDVDSDDALYLVSYLFTGGAPPDIPTAPKEGETIDIKTTSPVKQTPIQRK